MRELIAVAASVVAVGCAPHGDVSTDEPAVSTRSEIRIGLTEWSIHTGGAVAAPGEVELVVTNAGATAHDLVVEGNLGQWRTPLIDPGGRETLDVKVAAGETLTLTCSLPGHHDSGMHNTLQAGAPGTAGRR